RTPVSVLAAASRIAHTKLADSARIHAAAVGVDGAAALPVRETDRALSRDGAIVHFQIGTLDASVRRGPFSADSRRGTIGVEDALHAGLRGGVADRCQCHAIGIRHAAYAHTHGRITGGTGVIAL